MVFNPRTGLIIPKCVAARFHVAGAKGVGKPQMQDAAESRARFGLKKRVSGPRFGVVAIVRGRNDIVVAGENQRFLESQKMPDMAVQPLQPGKLLGESLRTRRIAVGRINRSYAHHAA